eukprot:1060841-Rhodomonas_salina.2
MAKRIMHRQRDKTDKNFKKTRQHVRENTSSSWLTVGRFFGSRSRRSWTISWRSWEQHTRRQYRSSHGKRVGRQRSICCVRTKHRMVESSMCHVVIIEHRTARAPADSKMCRSSNKCCIRTSASRSSDSKGVEVPGSSARRARERVEVGRVERIAQRAELVAHAPDRPHVALPVVRPVLAQLRAHVVRRANRRLGVGLRVLQHLPVENHMSAPLRLRANAQGLGAPC